MKVNYFSTTTGKTNLSSRMNRVLKIINIVLYPRLINYFMYEEFKKPKENQLI